MGRPAQVNTDERSRRIYRATIAGGVVNALLVVAKFIAGIAGNSAAMIADAVHSLSDFATDVVVLLFVKLSSKRADKDHPYGHGKYETIATSIIGVALLAVALEIGYDGVCKIYAVTQGDTLPTPGIVALIAALASILAKELVYRYTIYVSKRVNSPAMEANAWHHRSDALSSIGTAIGIGGAIALGSDWAILDPIAAVVVSIFIIRTALILIRRSGGELLEERLPDDTEQRIREIVYSTPQVEDVHNLYTRRIGSAIAIEMHLRLPGDMPLSEAHERARSIERALRAEYGSATHIMLHLEPIKPQK
ncbi:MAG: cation diffusion facilitator family transporter [Muribaculaceae bacterium]